MLPWNSSVYENLQNKSPNWESSKLSISIIDPVFWSIMASVCIRKFDIENFDIIVPDNLLERARWTPATLRNRWGKLLQPVIYPMIDDWLISWIWSFSVFFHFLFKGFVSVCRQLVYYSANNGPPNPNPDPTRKKKHSLN